MTSLAIIAVAIFGCFIFPASSPSPEVNKTSTICSKDTGDDNLLQQNEFSRFWLHFDDDGDGSVSKQEFDDGWRQEGFPHPQNAPLYFHELDVVHNDALDSQDFPHIFRLFDEDGNGAINEREARYNWNAYFSD